MNSTVQEADLGKENTMKKKSKPTKSRKPESAEAELERNLREHTRLERERTSEDDYREYGRAGDEKDGQK